MKAHSRIDTHEAVCAERYAGIQNSFRAGSEKMASIMRILTWGGTFGLGIIIGMMGWMASKLADLALKASGG